eukprot:4292595-Pleurochrysis_carterae.AAC.2
MAAQAAGGLLAFADESAAMDSARARIKASIASRGSSSSIGMLFERKTTRVCVPSGAQAVCES